MQTIYTFSYNPTIATGTNSTGTNWRMAYQQPIMLYKGTINSVRIVVFNAKQRIVDLTDTTIEIQIVDRETKEYFVTKTAVIDATIIFDDNELLGLENRFYHLTARLIVDSTPEILYLDDNYGVFTPVTIESAWDYNATVISTTDGLRDFRFTNLFDAPNTFSGFANKIVKVNGTETALEFSTFNTLSSNGYDLSINSSGHVVFPDNSIQKTAYVVNKWTPVLVNASQVAPDAFQRIGFDFTWNAGVYSKESHTSPCFVSATFSGPLAAIGLTSKPGVGVNGDYMVMSDYPNSTFSIFENGIKVVDAVLAWTPSTVIKIVYDGTNVIYYFDDLAVRTVSRTFGPSLYLTSGSYYSPTIGNVKFGLLDYQTPGVGIPSKVPQSSIGSDGDLQGMVAFNGTHIYYCVANYDGSTNIWKRVAWSNDVW